MISRRLKNRLRGDGGLTIVELLVSFALFGILATLAFTAVMSGAGNLRTVRQNSDLNEDARLVLNRISRELREAAGNPSAIPHPPGVINPDRTNPDGSERICPAAPPPCFNPKADVAITFDVDFTDNGISDPERLTYRYKWEERRLLLQTATESQPVMGGNVSGFKLSYRSSLSKCDANSDGQVTWQELEGQEDQGAPRPLACPSDAGSKLGGVSALDSELRFIDQVIIDITVETGSRKQQYRTKVDLRNQEVGP